MLNIQIPASAASATVGINVLDLIQTSLLVGKGKGTINLGLNIAGVGNISLNLLNPPRIAVGPAGKSLAGAWCTEAKSAQFSLKVGLNLNLLVAALDMALYVDTFQDRGPPVQPGDRTGQHHRQLQHRQRHRRRAPERRQDHRWQQTRHRVRAGHPGGGH